MQMTLSNPTSYALKNILTTRSDNQTCSHLPDPLFNLVHLPCLTWCNFALLDTTNVTSHNEQHSTQILMLSQEYIPYSKRIRGKQQMFKLV